jgi:UDP-N-acetyl-D-galactosamine dehydrogenase
MGRKAMMSQSAGTIVAVVGLGYVGLPVALAFGRHHRVIGVDLDAQRVAELRRAHDSSGEINSAAFLAAGRFEPTSDPARLREADIVIVCVPTPVDARNLPDWRLMQSAATMVGHHMKQNAIVVFESTVYPGATEEICIPLLEQASGGIWKRDFHVGYSPERINPGDSRHELGNVVKVVAGDTVSTLETLAELYRSVIPAGIFRAESIRVAEAAKIMENTQRDINIALVNECAMLFHTMGIDTQAVLKTAGTKWNFLPFQPGLVGGHCIGVDPYYLSEKARSLGHHPRVMLAGRSTNDGMAAFVAAEILETMKWSNHADHSGHTAHSPARLRVNILGLTYKENVSDIRNTKVADVHARLCQAGVECFVHDPRADPQAVVDAFCFHLTPWEQLPRAEALLLAVPHQEYREMGLDGVADKLLPRGTLFDLKSVFPRQDVFQRGLFCWRL